MFPPSSIQMWIGDQAVPLLAIGLALFIGFAVVYVSARTRRATLTRHRYNRNENTFVDELIPFGFDEQIGRTTYRYLQQTQNVSFPIEPSDDLDADLGLDSEDLQQTTRDLLAQLGREHLPGLLYSPLITVEDLVRYLQASPRRERRHRVA